MTSYTYTTDGGSPGVVSLLNPTQFAAILPPAAAAWGAVTGTLANQTDLQTALNAKGTSNFDGAYGSLTGKPTLGTAAATASTDYATAAQGTKADSAVQPAGLTKAAVGLGSCDNTADSAKPVSTAQQSALNLKANLTPTGATVTQQTNKATGVTINAQSGAITMNGAALAAAAEVSFVVTNSAVGANDVPCAVHKSAGTAGAYAVHCNAVGAGSFKITVGNWSAGSLSEAIVIQFVILKGAVA